MQLAVRSSTFIDAAGPASPSTAACLIAFAIVVAAAAAVAPPDVPARPWFPRAPSLPDLTGEVIRVSTVQELLSAVSDVEPGGTILLADGHYMMPRYFAIETDNVTLRGVSRAREPVKMAWS